jgi:hypothetical protein
MRIRDEYLEQLDIEVPRAANQPHFTYGRGSNCDHTIDLPIREQTVWCPLCRLEDRELSQLRRVFHSPSVRAVMHEHHNLTTGQVESDHRKFATHLSDAAKRHEDRLGFPAKYEPTHPVELRREMERMGKDTELGLPATHDRQIATGEKESKGKFVY